MPDVSKCALREVRLSDQHILFHWRNADHVRYAMLNQDKISEREHKVWFQEALGNPKKKYFIFSYNNKDLGSVGFFPTSCQDIYNWSFYIGEIDRPPGLGVIMASLALDRFFQNFRVDRLQTCIRANNFPSLRIHERLGFYKDQEDKNADILTFALNRNDWKQLAENLQL